LGLLEDIERFSQPLPRKVELVGSESYKSGISWI